MLKRSEQNTAALNFKNGRDKHCGIAWFCDNELVTNNIGDFTVETLWAGGTDLFVVHCLSSQMVCHS